MNKNRIRGASAGRAGNESRSPYPDQRRRGRDPARHLRRLGPQADPRGCSSGNAAAAMAEWPQPLQGIAAPWRAEVPRGGCCRLADRVLAHVRTSGRPTGAAQSVFRRPRSPPPPCSCPSLTRSNRRVRDPYARWWGRGGIVRCPPIPINPISSSRSNQSTRPSSDRSRCQTPVAIPARKPAALTFW